MSAAAVAPDPLVDAGPAGYDYVVFGTVPWDSPWLTEHNLAHALGTTRRVLYVEPPLTPLTPIRYGLRPETLSQARRVAGAGLRRSGRVHVLRPLTVPPGDHPRVRELAAPLVRAQIRRAVRRLGLERPVVVAARSILPYLGAADERACVYLVKDLTEAGAALIGKDAQLLAEEHDRMARRADLVCAVTPRLRDRIAGKGVDVELLRHGFHAELAPLYEAAAEPPEYADLPRPLLGFAGRIDGRLDLDAVAAVADRFSTGSVVLLGPVSPRLPAAALATLADRPNVHLLGRRERESLPGYLAHLDCSLIPYREDEWGRYGSPLKLWDYLYAGPPIVASGYEILADDPFVHYASPPARLGEAVAAALADDGGGAERRRAYALANTWDRRAEHLEELVAQHL